MRGGLEVREPTQREATLSNVDVPIAMHDVDLFSTCSRLEIRSIADRQSLWT